MRVIEPSVELIDCPPWEEIFKNLERCGRVCYKSEDRITADSAEKFIKGVIKSGHESVLEHEKITVKVICDRGVSHEIVRHRLASYSQESTRYCCYGSDKFNSELTVIKPCFWEEDSVPYIEWVAIMEDIEETYLRMIAYGAKPEEARSVLPNSLKTEIVMTMNIREWRHFFKMRLSSRAHPQMREVAKIIYKEFTDRIPVLFSDIHIQET